MEWASAIKMFYKNSDSRETTQEVLTYLQIRMLESPISQNTPGKVGVISLKRLHLLQKRNQLNKQEVLVLFRHVGLAWEESQLQISRMHLYMRIASKGRIF
ncbi:hypothetical protein TNIN_423551 [Trichonephila inaurata madagascariensis]|uniref:Uncharacterized protein n=1 Tax=Trichonephila inaurata madagascariensis TaxID=2747483 RepID=A0A8X6WQS1_9ARAC|nr:hypothetical protein TNIN_423551 [Trichonephila inaurata madagascariensis]